MQKLKPVIIEILAVLRPQAERGPSCRKRQHAACIRMPAPTGGHIRQFHLAPRSCARRETSRRHSRGGIDGPTGPAARCVGPMGPAPNAVPSHSPACAWSLDRMCEI